MDKHLSVNGPIGLATPQFCTTRHVQRKPRRPGSARCASNCGYCVEVCPEDAIRMDTGILDVAAYSRHAMKLDIHELMNPELRKPVGECTLSFPHQCRVSGGQMKGRWNRTDVESSAAVISSQ